MAEVQTTLHSNNCLARWYQLMVGLPAQHGRLSSGVLPVSPPSVCARAPPPLPGLCCHSVGAVSCRWAIGGGFAPAALGSYQWVTALYHKVETPCESARLLHESLALLAAGALPN